MSEAAKCIPLIRSGVAGPLGLLHLPRLWQKASLATVGKLHPAYPACGKGFDQMVLDALGIGREAFLAFIAAEKPCYPELERWILRERGRAMDPALVAELNRCIAGYSHVEDTREAILNDCGIAGDGSARDAVTLNNLDDWQAFHAALGTLA